MITSSNHLMKCLHVPYFLRLHSSRLFVFLKPVNGCAFNQNMRFNCSTSTSLISSFMKSNESAGRFPYKFLGFTFFTEQRKMREGMSFFWITLPHSLSDKWAEAGWFVTLILRNTAVLRVWGDDYLPAAWSHTHTHTELLPWRWFFSLHRV